MNIAVPNTTSVMALAAAAGQPMAPGIYFGLDEEIYHRDPSLGSGSIRALAKCPIYYWVDSWMNPLREPQTETPALLFGRALHKLVLEGPEAFAREYRCAPEKSDYPEALDTATEIKAALKSLGQKQVGNKPELIERLRFADPGAVFWDDIITKHNDDCARDGATSLKTSDYARIVAGAGMIAGDERVRAAFQGGRPEVSIFWVEGGVPMKARLDYAKLGLGAPSTYGYIKKDDRLEYGATDIQKHGPIGLANDLKSFANVMDKPPELAVIRAIAETRLDIQAAAYLQGIVKIPEFYAAGKVYGAEGINAEWLETLCTLPIERWVFNWVFYQKDAPVSLLRTTRPGSPMITGATMNVLSAQQAYRDNMEAFGTNWRFVDPIPDPEVSETDLPKWLYAGV